VDTTKMILSGDVGGTKTLLGVFEPASPVRTSSLPPAMPRTRIEASPRSSTSSIDPSGGACPPLRAAVVGVAGPVLGGVSRLTNISWDISEGEIARQLGRARVEIVNDLAALAYSVEDLAPMKWTCWQPGTARTDGNAAVIAAGTGLARPSCTG
jgi:glucokinase